MGAIKNDITYDGKYNLNLDIYEADNPKNITILDIHGGGWFRGDKKKDTDIGEFLSDKGFNVVIPNYRNAPDYFYPAPLEDMDNVINWINKKYPNSQIIVLGSSAGGNMSVELAIKYGFAAISLSGIFDIDDWLQMHHDVKGQRDQEQDFTNSPSSTINQSGGDDSFYKWFILNYLNNDESVAPNATLYHRINEKTGPLFIANSLDEFVPNSGVLKLSEVLSHFKIPFTIKLISGHRHAKGYIEDIWPTILDFINENSKKRKS